MKLDDGDDVYDCDDVDFGDDVNDDVDDGEDVDDDVDDDDTKLDE